MNLHEHIMEQDGCQSLTAASQLKAEVPGLRTHRCAQSSVPWILSGSHCCVGMREKYNAVVREAFRSMDVCERLCARKPGNTAFERATASSRPCSGTSPKASLGGGSSRKPLSKDVGERFPSVQVGVLVVESGGADWLWEREVSEEEGR